MLICLLTPLKKGLCHRGGIGVPKFMPTGTHDVTYTQWEKSDVHETLSLLFAQEGVPSTLVMEQENRLWVNSGVRLGKQIAM